MNLDERIELHIHSKEGGDSTVYAEEIIKKLNAKGIPAVAITDTSSIFCFTDVEMAMNYGKYAIRPIYGMEMPVVDEKGNKYSISILVKNATGLENLYTLVSDNVSLEDFPNYRLEEVLKYREGLLLGSGVENGKIYQMLAENASTEDLKEALSLFDYAEVVPFEKYQSVNLRILNACEELKIPVAAVSDAHYIDSEDWMAYKVICHWRKKGKCKEEYRFLTTEEMLQAFSYLPEEKAREIVIKNTHRIADMCETVPIIPKKICHPKLKNATEILRDCCYKNLEKKYTGSERTKAEERLETELAALQKTELESFVLVVRELLDKCQLRSCDISIKGCAAGSIVLYLMEISEIDPLKYGLEPEIIFGLKNHREMDIDLYLPTNRQEELIQKVGTLTGIEAAVRAGTFMVASHAFAETLVEDYAYDMEDYPSDERKNEIASKLKGNFAGRGKHTGGMVLFPSGYDYRKITPLSMAMDGTSITYYESLYLLSSFVKLDLISYDPLEMLHRLSGLTGVDLTEVPTEAPEALELFTPDENGEITKCADLPEFCSEETREIVRALKPACFEDLVKICAMSHGAGCWKVNEQILTENKEFGIKEILGSRDDVFHYILALGVDRTTAFEISDAVRKGIISRGKNVKWANWKKILLQNGAEEWFLQFCERVCYLLPKADAVSRMIVNMRLGWFKVHYPEEFKKIAEEYEEERF